MLFWKFFQQDFRKLEWLIYPSNRTNLLTWILRTTQHLQPGQSGASGEPQTNGGLTEAQQKIRLKNCTGSKGPRPWAADAMDSPRKLGSSSPKGGMAACRTVVYHPPGMPLRVKRVRASTGMPGVIGTAPGWVGHLHPAPQSTRPSLLCEINHLLWTGTKKDLCYLVLSYNNTERAQTWVHVLAGQDRWVISYLASTFSSVKWAQISSLQFRD